MQRLELAEAASSSLEAATALGNGRYRVLLVKAGWGSSGFYSEEVLRRDGPQVWPVGTQQYLDHQTETERKEKPEGSVHNWASIITSAPVWDADERGLVAEVEVYPQWQFLLNPRFVKDVGLSIRAYGFAEHGEAEGREGPIITSLTEGISVDWVTRAGAGGRVLELIESARQAPVEMREARNVGAWVESRIHASFTVMADDMYGAGRLSRQERIGLSSAIGDALDAFVAKVEADLPQLYQRDLWDGPDDGTEVSETRRLVAEAHGMTARDLDTALSDAVRAAHGGKNRFAWTRDYTDDWVVYSVESDTGSGLYQQTYHVTGGAATLTGQPTEVRAHTTYTPAGQPPPATAPATEATTNAPGTKPADEKKEGLVPEITDEQARQLDEAATARAALETRLAEAEQRATKAETDLAEATATVDARLTQITKRLDESEQRAVKAEARNRELETERIARTRVAEALRASPLPELAHTRVTESVCRDLPYGEDGHLDSKAFAEATKKAIDDEQTYLAAVTESTGVGAPRGLGGPSDPQPLDEAALDAELESAFAGIGLSEAALKTAVAGR